MRGQRRRTEWESEVKHLQEVSEGLPPEARRRVMALGLEAVALDLAARHGAPGSDPWSFWARCYHGVTDTLADAWDLAYASTH
ncbi:hypothetical protein G4V39_02310 [Thermosulfuriphilus ammonigenes]|uniref:Uncharacterized protein n=1 Tax=Thermosulfuriphilus ammonigenes TaxID=1936021 RepID=A0A6G7PUQ9_9BACT|nr:hypothetical protein [Thermosulfuriphilus ammonigenes]QIJ71178.1 hypothetical protein G4V39_02310 [Thermosulfuriphilus ammonigenes]